MVEQHQDGKNDDLRITARNRYLPSGKERLGGEDMEAKTVHDVLWHFRSVLRSTSHGNSSEVKLYEDVRGESMLVLVFDKILNT